MKLSEIGEVIDREWYRTEEIRLQVKLDGFVIMPNHIHGIVKIDNTGNLAVETHCNASSSDMNKSNNTQKNNLSNIIRGFKSSSTKAIHMKGFSDFQWQPRFHEHIIRNEKSLNQIREYIKNNPLSWNKDTNNPNNILEK